MAFIEETIVLKDVKLEEINKYYIQDDLSETERITYILKKGYQCQKEKLIINLPYLYFKNYPKNTNLISSTINSIMENIELSEKKTQILYGKALGELGERLSSIISENKNNKSFSSKLQEENITQFTVIIKHFLVCISTLEKTVSDEYILNFTNLIEHCQKIDFRTKISKEIVEYASSLGKFGQNITNRKFSIFFCVNLMQISIDRENDIYKRLELLFDDNERLIRFEIAYQIRYIIKENDVNYCINNLVTIITSLFNEIDLMLRAIIIESMLFNNNFRKFETEKTVCNIMINAIDESFQITDFYALTNDFNNLINIFINLISSSVDDDYNRKIFLGLIKNFLKKFFFVNEMKNSTNVNLIFRVDYGLKNFDKILIILSKENEIQFIKDIFGIAIKYFFGSKENLKDFYKILPEICKNIPKEMLTKNFFQKTLFFFDFENLCLGNQEFDEEFLHILPLIADEMIKTENDEFINFIISKLHNIIPLISKLKNWRNQAAVITLLLPFPLYLIINYTKYLLFEDIYDILFNFCKDFLSKGRNYQLEKEITKLLVELLRCHLKQRENIIAFINESFLNNNSFFRRRVYAFFTDACLKSLSFSSCKKSGIFDNFLHYLLIKDVPLMKCLVLSILEENKIYSEEIKEVVNGLITKQGNKDIEFLENANKYLINCSNVKNNKDLEENAKIDTENKIKQIYEQILENLKKDEMMIKKPRIRQVKTVSGSNSKNSKIKRKTSLVVSSNHTQTIGFDKDGNCSPCNSNKIKKNSVCITKGVIQTKQKNGQIPTSFTKGSTNCNKK